MPQPEAGLSFGDRVRIRATAETGAAGVAGASGTVFSFTTPSVTHVKVIGEAVEEFAVAVDLADRRETLWFATELVELVDHNNAARAERRRLHDSMEVP